jgi:hypothetical protein
MSMMIIKKTSKLNLAIYSFVVLIGSLQIIGHLTGVDNIRNLGRITSSSPLPLVFSEVNGVEPFASDFYLQYKNENGENQKVKITPEIYSRLKGPYNRRNIYGAAISYGPVLPEQLWKSVINYGLCNEILKDELQVPVSKDNFSIYIETKTKDRSDNWTLNANCE